MSEGVYIGAMLFFAAFVIVSTALLIYHSPAQYEHVTLTRSHDEFLAGPYTRAECKEQVRRGEFLDNNLHYCRPVR